MSLGELMFLMQFEPIKEILRLMSYLFVGMVGLAIFTYFMARLALRYHKSVNETIARMERAVKQVKEVTKGGK